MGVNCYVSVDADGLGQKLGRASLHDDVAEVRRLSQAIDAGQRIWTSWALSTGGSVVSAGGDEVRLEIPIERLQELPALREDYGRCVGATASVGVGMTLGEADKALLSAKIHGKNRVKFWTPEVDEEVDKLSRAPKTEVEKVTDEYLSGAVAKAEQDHEGAKTTEHAPCEHCVGKGECGCHTGVCPFCLGYTCWDCGYVHDKPEPVAKAEPSASMSSPALVGGAGGMAGQAGPGAPAGPDAGAAAAPSPSAGVPQEASTTHAAQDFEEQMHELAGTQGQKDAASAQQAQAQAQQGQRQDALRQKVVSVLKAVQKQSQVLEQVKSQAPAVYKVVMACVQTLILAAKELRGEPPEQLQGGQGGDDSSSSDSGESVSSGDEVKKSEEAKKHRCSKCGSRHIDFSTAFAESGKGEVHPRGDNGIGHCIDCGSNKLELIEKAELKPPPNATTKIPAHHHVIQPVGATADNKVKIRHGSGETGWVQVASGQILSQDGHAISSLNPGGR